MVRNLMIAAAAAVLFVPASASAQILPGVGIGFGQQQQLGPPPAGVLLHQQYMQLYGLPVNFTQGAVNNGGGQGILPGFGFGGGWGGGFPRYFGVNYQRNMAAMQAYQAYQYQAAMQNAYANRYGMNPQAGTMPQQQASVGGYGMASSNAAQPQFAQSTVTTNRTPTFGGFGLTSTPNPFFSDLKKDDKKDDKKEDR